MHQFLNLLSGKLRATAALSIFCLTTLLAGSAFATDYYVALTGVDTGNEVGSEANPFRTIGKAAANAGPGDVVYVLPGTYRETAIIKKNGATFKPRDGKGSVTLNGADLMLDWTVASGSTYKTTMSWDLGKDEATKKWGTNQVFQDGTMIELARWPKQTSSDIVMPTNAKLDTAYNGSQANTIVFVDSDFNEPAARWIGAKVWVNLAHHGFDGQGRTGTVVAINGNAITVLGGDGRGIGRLGETTWGIGRDTEYFLFDPAPAALATDADIDAALAPGEWWKNGNNLYVKTRTGGAPAATATATSNRIESKRRHFAFLPQSDWQASNFSGYTIEDFDLFACSISTDGEFNNSNISERANNITLKGLTVKYVSHQTVMQGDYQSEHYAYTGIILSGRNNILRDCDIMYSATSAVSMIGAGHKFLNNKIHETNYMCSNSGAINTGYQFACMDSEIAYNEIWNTTMMGVNEQGFKNSNPDVRHVARIHHNEIYDFMLRSYDSGALDVVGMDLQWVRIDHNRIYNTRPEAKIGDRKYGIYLDYGGGPNSLNRVRATVDHNVVWDVTNPMTLNTAQDAHIFNNVFLKNIVEVNTGPSGPGSGVTGIDAEAGASLSIGLRPGEAPKAGTNVLVYNNILGDPISFGNPTFGYALKEQTESILNNITNASGAVLEQLFVDATSAMVPGQKSARNYQLKASATAAIDKGIKVDEFTSNYPLDRAVVGLTDIGAFEYPTSPIGADAIPPSVPVATNFVVANLTGNGFTLSWTASTDNVGVAYYEVYSNGALYKRTNEPTISLTKLEGSTTYFMQVLAVDASGNRSAISEKKEVKTLAPVVDADIAKTSVAPVIDGTKEATWTSPMLPIAKLAGGTAPANAADFSGEWTSLWDDSNLYLFIDVNDNVKVVDDPAANGKEWYFDDHIEIMIDPTFARIGGPKQYFMVRGKQFYRSFWNGSAVVGADVLNSAASLVEKADGSGYRVEVKIPFAALGITPQALSFIGIDVQIGDDDDGGNEDTRLSWITNDPSASGNASVLGVAKLTAPGLGDDTEKPSAPTAVVAGTIAPTSFTLNWAASTDNFGVASYEVFVNGNLVGTPNTTTFTVEKLTEGTTYSVQVRAKDRYNNLSDLSSVLKVTTPTKASAVIYESENAVFVNGTVATAIPGFSGTGYVRGISIHSGGGSITYTVNVPTAGTYAAFVRYNSSGRLTYYVNGDKIGSVIFPGVAPGTWGTEYSTMSLNLRAGTNTVQLIVDNTSDNGPLHDYLGVFLPGADSQAPTAPTSLRATNTTSSGFTLNWTASTDNSSVTGYQIYQDGTLVGTSTGTTFNVTSLSPGTYVMTVKALDAAGNQSDASNAIELDIIASGSVSAGPNPGFENNFTSWTTYGTASINTANVRPGSSGAKSGYFSNGGAYYVVNGLTPGTTYKVRAWVKAVSGQDIWIVVNGFDGAKNPGQKMTSTTWTQSGDILFTPTGTSVTLNAWTGNGSSAYFDDYTIELNSSSSSVPVRKVIVTPASVSFTNRGITKQLEATVVPFNATNNSLVWSSSNTAVATVSSTGLVTSVGEGTATITATTNDGGKTASSLVTVTRVWTKIDDADANKGITYGANWRGWTGPHGYYLGTMHGTEDASLLQEATFSFTGTKVRYYGGANYDLGIAQVFLDDVLVATVDLFSYTQGYDKVTYESADLAYGAHTLKIKATGTKNPSSSGNSVFIDAFDYTTYGCTSCREANAEVASRKQTEVLKLQVHPNPASSEVTIDLSGFAHESSVQVKMSDMTGKLHLGQQVQISEGVKQVTLPVNHLPQGLFFVTVQGSKTARTAKLVITK
jgi:uncharacterized protein YjdB